MLDANVAYLGVAADDGAGFHGRIGKRPAEATETARRAAGQADARGQSVERGSREKGRHGAASGRVCRKVKSKERIGDTPRQRI